MLKAFPLAGCGACLFATPALAADSPFTGTWKLDTETAKATTKPDIFEIKDGMYRCPSCTPALVTPADGAFHKVAGHDYWDELSVTPVDARHVSYMYRRGGTTVEAETDELSADGNQLVSTSISTDNPKHEPTTTTATEFRTAPAPAGAHALSGTWKAGKLTAASDNYLKLNMAVTATTMTLTYFTGEHFTATLGGDAVPFQGDPAGTLVKVRSMAANVLETTGIRAGKPAWTASYTVAADGRSITGHTMDFKTGTTHDFIAYKQ